MARIRVSDEYPHGHELGAILDGIRAEVLKGSHRITHDGNPQIRHLVGHVLDSNRKAIKLLNEAMSLVESMVGFPGSNRPVPVLRLQPLSRSQPAAGPAKRPTRGL